MKTLIKTILTVFIFLALHVQAGAAIRQAGDNYEFYDVQRPELKAVFPNTAHGLEKDIYVGKTGVRLKLARPPYENLATTMDKTSLRFKALSGETFIYRQSANRKSAILKEWIETPVPNADFGSQYVWQVTAMDKANHVHIRKVKHSAIIEVNKKPIILIKPIIFVDKNGYTARGHISVEGDLLKIKIQASKKQYPLRIDPSLQWGQWLGGSGDGGQFQVQGMAYNTANSSIDIGGFVQAGGTVTEMGISNVGGAYQGGTDGFVVEVLDGGTPSINWGQWLGGNGTDQVNAMAVNGTKIYAAGFSTASTSWESVPFQGSDTGGSEAFVVEILDGGTPSLVWGQWLGGNGNDTIYNNGLIVNGTKIYVGGSSTSSSTFESVSFQGSQNSGSDGFVIEMLDGGTPSLVWGQWLGGNGADEVNALALSGSKIYAGGYSTKSTSWETVTFQGTHTGGSEGFVVEMLDGGTPSLVWGQWLGGDGDDEVNGLSLNGSKIYAAGYSTQSSNWETMTFQGTHTGGSEAFVVEITDGGTPSLNWGQWLGGDGNDSIAVITSSATKIYVGGLSDQSTLNWETVPSSAGSQSGSNEGFVVEILDGGTPSLVWRQWLGGTSSDYLSGLYLNGSNIYVAGSSFASTAFESTTFQGNHSGGWEGFAIKMTDGGTPSLTWGQWMGGGTGETAAVNAIGTGNNKIYAGGVSIQSTGWPFTLQGAQSGSGEGFVVAINDGGTPSISWGQWLGGVSYDTVLALASSGGNIYAGGWSAQSTGWESTNWQGSHSGALEGFVVKILDGGTPSLAWGQWLGSTGNDEIYQLALNGSNVYASGWTTSTISFEPVTFQGAITGGREGWIIKIADGGTPSLVWGQFMGGDLNDETYAVAVNGSKVYGGGYSNSSTGWESMNFQGTFSGLTEGYVLEIADGGTPSLVWAQWLGGNDTDVVNAVAASGNKIYAGGTSLMSTGWENVTFQGAFSGLSEGFVVEILDGGTPSLIWGQWLGGTSNDLVESLAVNGNTIYAVGYTGSSTGWENVSFQGAHSGNNETFIVAIADGGTPSLSWGQWLGGNSADIAEAGAIAFNGNSLYVGGYSVQSTSWEMPFQGSFTSIQQAFVAKEDVRTFSVGSTFFDVNF